jgi:hypothetical protein
MENSVPFMTKIKFHLDFMKHSNVRNKNHFATQEDIRLRQVLIQNYFKSFLIGNSIALYLNYLRKNKSFYKTFMSNIFPYN